VNLLALKRRNISPVICKRRQQKRNKKKERNQMDKYLA